MTIAAPPTSSLPEIGVWTIDSVHSSVVFSVRHHAVATFRTGFTNITGSYDAEHGRLQGEVTVSELDLGIERLKGHLLSPAFFNAEEHPTFSFVSTRVSSVGDELTFEGELTLRGITRPVTGRGRSVGPLTVTHGDGRVTDRFGLDLTTTIDRREWDVNFNNEVAEGLINLGWDVRIDAALELVKE